MDNTFTESEKCVRCYFFSYTCSIISRPEAALYLYLVPQSRGLVTASLDSWIFSLISPGEQLYRSYIEYRRLVQFIQN